jgi:hypothetical protein
MQKSGSLTVTGCGIKFLSHLTVEAKACIEQADKVFYLINEPAMSTWLQTHHPHAQSLDAAYTQFINRNDTYQAITQTILQALKPNLHICMVLEGHPTVFAKPALEAVKQAKKMGYSTFILPGISTEDYLFATCGIDPGSVGCHSYEATDFLIHKRVFDGISHLILWQVSVIGMLENNPHHHHQAGTRLLVDYLSRCYPLSHEVILFEGSQYPHITSRIDSCRLQDLPSASISRTTTLYLPPAHPSICDPLMMAKLKQIKE